MVPDYIHEQAMAAAAELLVQLNKRLIGAAHPAFVGKDFRAGPSTVIEVCIPENEVRFNIARHSQWFCRLQDDCSLRWRTPLSTLIAEQELFPLFRNAFAGIQVQLHLPEVKLCNDEENAGRQFNPSGMRLRVTPNNQLLVQPIGDLSQSPWLNARLWFTATPSPYCGCVINPLAFQWLSVGSRQFSIQEVCASRLPTFCICLANGDAPCYLPIARVISMDGDGMTVELDASVERS